MILTIFSAAGLISLVTLVLLEIILGIDNIIFIAILCSYLPQKDQQRARTIGLMLAMAFRIILLIGISYLVRMTDPLFYIMNFGASGRDLILFAGGIFLAYKTIHEVIHKLHGDAAGPSGGKRRLTVAQAILQITVIDIVFSFDSILTAVGLSRDLSVMITAVVISMFVMLFFAPYVGHFMNKFPTIKMLALVFLIGIGLLLILEALHIHVEKAYIYVAMIFSLIVELLNIRLRKVKQTEQNPE